MKKTILIFGLVLVAALATAYTLKPKHRLALPGTFFLVQRVSFSTQYGVTGIPAGTRVQLLEDKGDNVLVQDNDIKCLVSADILTNEVDIGELASKTDPRSQQAFVAALNQLRAENFAAHTKGPNQDRLISAASFHRPFICDSAANNWWRR